MSSQGFNLEFKMFLEGIEVKFISATLSSSPAGNTAQITMYANKLADEILPKTAVQIFFREFAGPTKGKWSLIFDGYYSSMSTQEGATGGRLIYIIARDFGNDLNKAIVPIVIGSTTSLTGAGQFEKVGVSAYIVTKALDKKGNVKLQSRDSYVTDGTGGGLSSSNTAIFSLDNVLRTFALQAEGGNERGSNQRNHKESKKSKYVKPGQAIYNSSELSALITGGGHIRHDYLLDAIYRGMLMRTAGATSYMMQINTRIRGDKKLAFMSNYAGFMGFNDMHTTSRFGAALMGGGKYVPVFSLIMRLAALSQTEQTFQLAPTLIDLSDKETRSYFISDNVANFCVEKDPDFGEPYMLNECMVIPNLGLTAPPDCNLIFPSMYESISISENYDAKTTRGIYQVVHVLGNASTGGTNNAAAGLAQYISVPTSLRPGYVSISDKSAATKKDKAKLVRSKFHIPALSYEEKLMGVNVDYNTIEQQVALDCNKYNKHYMTGLSGAAKEDLDNLQANIQMLVAKSTVEEPEKTGPGDKLKKLTQTQVSKMQAYAKKLKKRAARLEKVAKGIKRNGTKSRLDYALERNATVKFIFDKFKSPTIQVKMAFNPYLLCGFSSVVFSPKNTDTNVEIPDMIGTIQQVQHVISINQNAATASTSVVITAARRVDRPTYIDNNGNTIYNAATVPENFKVDEHLNLESDKKILEGRKGKLGFSKTILGGLTSIPEGVPMFERDNKSVSYDTKTSLGDIDAVRMLFPYARDIISLSAYDKSKGASNSMLLDYDYEPIRISKFYKYGLGIDNQMMIGTAADTTGKKFKFAYNTIHEAVEKFKDNHDFIYDDMDKSYSHIHRNIVSAEDFYVKIMNASVELDKEDVENVKDANEGDYKIYAGPGTKIRREYHGVETDSGDKLNTFGESYKDLNLKPGDSSSILETFPVTPFCKERKDAVKNYLNSLKKFTFGD